MPNHFNERWGGPIKGLLLPLSAWNSLRDAGITTIDQLTAVAGQLERLPGIGVKIARVIREEITRVSALER
jgi:endonuclease III